MLTELIPDIPAHCHICPMCDKEHYCTLRVCEDIQFVLCENCMIEESEVC